ncbi:MAG: flagellar basal body P-ring formation chaperone FlgA [Pseudomonadota bacterium]
MGRLPLLLALLLSAPATLGAAEQTLVARLPIRAQTIVTATDVTLLPGTTPGALSAPEEAVGLETRVPLYPGRPILATQLGPPALVTRNQIVTLRFSRGGLEIVTEARALDRAGLEERVRVMNLKSRVTVTGIVAGPGLVEVRP